MTPNSKTHINDTRVPVKCIEQFMTDVLLRVGCDQSVAEAVGSGLSSTSLRGVDSHGIRLFPHYVRALEGGRVNGFPRYRFERHLPAVARLDGDHTFGHASGIVAMNHAIQMAKEVGVGSVAVCNSTHFGAAACYGLLPADQDMIGLCFTHASPLLVPDGGIRPFFGANPICFTAPMEGESPFCLDMSVTQITWNHVKLCRERREKLASPQAFDKEGNPTTDPFEAVSLAPIGGYKGYGLSIMVDILCGLLTGMPVGDKVSNMYGNPIGEKRLLGQFYLVLKIDGFEDVGTFKKRLKALADAARREPRRDLNTPVLFPGDPEKMAEIERRQGGIPVEAHLMKELSALATAKGIVFNP